MRTSATHHLLSAQPSSPGVRHVNLALLTCETFLASVIESVDAELLADTGGPYARVRLDRWMVELISEYVESQRPSDIRAFVREAVITHLGLRRG